MRGQAASAPLVGIGLRIMLIVRSPWAPGTNALSRPGPGISPSGWSLAARHGAWGTCG